MHIYTIRLLCSVASGTLRGNWLMCGVCGLLSNAALYSLTTHILLRSVCSSLWIVASVALGVFFMSYDNKCLIRNTIQIT
jgi:hypothetical protein